MTAEDQILAHNLYVAMTRARSLLAISSLESLVPAVRRLNDVFESSIALLEFRPTIVSLDSDEDAKKGAVDD